VELDGLKPGGFNAALGDLMLEHGAPVAGVVGEGHAFRALRYQWFRPAGAVPLLQEAVEDVVWVVAHHLLLLF
jgi:hypothetical protein